MTDVPCSESSAHDAGAMETAAASNHPSNLATHSAVETLRHLMPEMNVSCRQTLLDAFQQLLCDTK